jgi:hypothetical protein
MKSLTPEPILDQGEHHGYRWMVLSNTYGCRCGYVLIPVGHPWHGREKDDINAAVHGGVTWSSELAGFEGYWVGFDCGHAWDSPDPALPADLGFEPFRKIFAEGAEMIGGAVRTAAYVRTRCEYLCERAAVVGGSN